MTAFPLLMNAPTVSASAAPQHRAWRRMMLALIVMTISQCCYYEKPTTHAWNYQGTARTYIGGKQFANIPTNQLVTTQFPGKTGWELHKPHATYLIGAMFVVFGLLIDLGPWWARRGYWIGVLGLVFCMAPFHLEAAPGYGLLFGVVALFLGISAARLRGRTPVETAPPLPT